MKTTETIEITEQEIEELTADELRMVAGGSDRRGELMDKATEQLKEAGERAWAVLGEKNELWRLINTAENSSSTSERREYIDKASDNMTHVWYKILGQEDHGFIRDKLSRARIFNSLAERA